MRRSEYAHDSLLHVLGYAWIAGQVHSDETAAIFDGPDDFLDNSLGKTHLRQINVNQFLTF